MFNINKGFGNNYALFGVKILERNFFFEKNLKLDQKSKNCGFRV